jgi:hypothetical protein
MDIVAHMLWAGAGTVLAARHVIVTRRKVAGVIALAALPDLLQFLCRCCSRSRTAASMAWHGTSHGSWSSTTRRRASSSPGPASAEQPVSPITKDRTSCRIEIDQAAAPRSENNDVQVKGPACTAS